MSETPAPDYIKYMDIAEFRELGLVQEINRLILHPLGLALEVKVDETGEHLGGVWDWRDDPEGIIFEGDIMERFAERATAIANMLEERGAYRLETLGYVIQPLPPEAKQLKVSVLEPMTVRVPGPGEHDQGEEQRFAALPND